MQRICHLLDMFEPALCLSTSLTDLATQLDTTVLLPWLTEIAQDENIKFFLSDQVHAVPTYTVIVDSSLEFTTYVYNWPIPGDHKICNDHKHSIKSVEDVRELLSTIKTSKICEGVCEGCESRCIECQVIMETSDELCNPCSKASKQLKKRTEKRTKVIPINANFLESGFHLGTVFGSLCDIPHLMKTAQNCLYNSGSGSCSRLMWNYGQYPLFRHIADIFYWDQAVALHVLPKLTLEHIVLTSFSKMKVKLATQVLSRSVALALEESGNSKVLGTAEFYSMMNDFFDCTNVRSLREHERKRNDLIKTYTAIDDDRFDWLHDVFLKYLENWKRSTVERAGQYSADDRGKMFLSSQTHEGLQIAVHFHVEAIQFLLQQGFQYVLSERFMQDVLEDYFGHQRAKGGRADNPSAYEFGYNDLTIAAQRDIAPVVRGNVGGPIREKEMVHCKL
ncbi:Hypothetical predicted protein [Paramuricea clavata]|uniref:Transposable element P transposase-like GTP-binding insertion domain-containing protein n=1 Tax=Paramuricea clavata TaxID=317549 RepID=A0A6S7I1C0_PARCT|nr:Hypothetical predicted protein [Paramuricea clavata]